MRIECVEVYCSDCGSTYYVVDYYNIDFRHCLNCGGVNVSEVYMTLDEYLDITNSGLKIVENPVVKREEIWNRIKNLNTDDELDEIEKMLFEDV